MNQLELIDLREETDSENCWALYNQAAEEAFAWYTFGLQSATVALDACLYQVGVTLAACLAAAAAEPTPTEEAVCAAQVAAEFAGCWAAYYAAAEIAETAYQSSMATAVSYRDNCTENAIEYAAQRRQLHNDIYILPGEQTDQGYHDCVNRFP